jgi:hypothetical protein
MSDIDMVWRGHGCGGSEQSQDGGVTLIGLSILHKYGNFESVQVFSWVVPAIDVKWEPSHVFTEE